MAILPETRDTIVAQATPPGAGALAVLRLTGPGAFAAAAAFLGPSSRKPRHAEARLAAARDGARLVDRVVAVFFKSPRSYTGEDTVEITCHGSPYITRTLLNLAVRHGARPARPGEFTLRAFLNGKLDLAQAEAVGRLVESSTEGAHRAALTQAEGGLSRKVESIKAALVELLAGVEVRLDDSYEEMPALDRAAFAGRAAAALREVKSLAAGYAAGRGVRDGLKVVIAGAPNSGKSSLLNALLGRDRAMVSGRAGTTRDTLEAELEVHGFKVVFTDTAGLDRGGRGALEREGMRRAREALAKADIALLLKDGSAPSTAADRLAAAEAARLLPPGARLLRVRSKADLPRRGAAAKGEFLVSSKTGLGLPRLRAALVADQRRAFRDGAQAVVTSARHYAALSGAAAELQGLLRALKPAEPPLELAAEHLRGALAELAALLGETAPEEVLAGIFGNFCVGK